MERIRTSSLHHRIEEIETIEENDCGDNICGEARSTHNQDNIATEHYSLKSQEFINIVSNKKFLSNMSHLQIRQLMIDSRKNIVPVCSCEFHYEHLKEASNDF